MIYLLTGQDEYRKSQRLKALELAINDPSNLNVLVFEDNIDLKKIMSEAQTMPFLAPKKLVVIKGILGGKSKETVKEVEKWLPNVPDEVELVFVEDEAKPPVIKLFSKFGKVEIFETLKAFQLTKWIQDKTTELGGEIAPQAADKLGLMIGPDLVRLENELKKLITYEPKVTDENIKNMVNGGFFDSIFTLMDAVSEKNSKKSLNLLEGFLDNDESELYLLSMLIRQVRNLIMVTDLKNQGKSEGQIASETKLHPYVVKKSLSQSRNFDMPKLLKMHNELLKTDEALKTSAIEPKIVLTRLVISFTN